MPFFNLGMDLESENSFGNADTPGPDHRTMSPPPIIEHHNQNYDFYGPFYCESMIYHWMSYVSMYNNSYYNGSIYGNLNAAPVWMLTTEQIIILCRILRDHGYF